MNGMISVDIFAQDSTATDTTMIGLDADSVASDSIPKGMKFIYRPPSGPVSVAPAVQPGKLYYIKSAKERFETIWDTTDTYTVQRKIEGIDVGVPSKYTFSEFAQHKKRQQIKQIQYELIEEGKQQQADQKGLLDFSLQIPGGESSVFTTIFGKPEVNLRVNGSANMNVGVSIQNIDDPTIAPDLQRRIDPTFNQNLQLNIQGTIGDKLTIATDWDTERAFDFQNRLSIVYRGYEDEIIKQIELGNVSMETGNSLIRGGASLFGIKSIAELGPLKLTSVVSQQKGESETETITGGSQETQISIRPIEYQNNRHFFIDFYNRQEFEDNVENPQQITQAYQISDIKVWISEPQINTTDPEAVRAAAFADLGVVEGSDGTYSLPNPALDSIDDNLLEQNRSNTSASAADFNVSGNDFYNGYFRPLQEGADYTIYKALGYISLNRTLSTGAYLAVSFVRRGAPGEGVDNIEVGDISSQSPELTYLKLLRTDNPTPDLKTWPLTMRNVYSLGVSDLTQDGLELDIKFTSGNVDDTNLPNRSSTLLQDLGLDRTDTQGALSPDNRIDFSGMVLDPRTGVILFPYLEPFGGRIADLLEASSASDSVINSLAYTELYNEKQSTADNSNKNNYYKIEGSSKGGVSGNFTLGFSLVEGSVKVFANGTELTEGVDYEVDYSFGSITILNEQYLAAGQDIQIEYENNQLNQIGQKNFTGLRAEYKITDDIQIGGTYFKLKEQPLSDKIRVENESINNTILGMDATAEFETPWVTRLIDKVPLLQTKAESNVSFSGEFAQLRPGVSQTNAVREAIDNGELYPDEENGLSFVDDFEGSEVSISLNSATRWNLAAAPAAITGYEPDAAFFENETSPITNSLESKIARSDLRSQFSWYTIPRNVESLLGGVQRTAESRKVLTESVFPGREVVNAQDQEISTLDVYYNPQERGPYNYNYDLKNKLENEPEKMWGGMTAVLPSGQEDLTQNNIEFIEFWVQPILPGGREPTAQDLEDYDGKIFIEIGTISEDVVPNFDLNTEDGLASNPDNLEPDNLSTQPRSFVPANPTAPQGQFSNENRDLEDVGFDGVPNTNGFDDEKVETALFAEFIDSMRVSYGENSPEFQSILADPSNDDYVYYGEGIVQDLPLNERFHRLLGYHEGNTPVAGGEKRAITPRPDTEGLKSRSNIETNNNYYQYEIALNPAEDLQIETNPDQLDERTYIVDRVPGDFQEERWHLVRIPLSDFKRKVGEIDGFQNISHIRMWMSGYKKPFTMRFATFEFIGSQWRKVENIDETQNTTGDFQVSTINIEENANREPVPYRQPEGSIRALNRGVQVNTLQNEQSIVLKVEELGPQQIQMIKRVYPGGLNLLNYSNMRMFVHGEGYRENSQDLGRTNAELVIRMGTDLNTNYYEYRQPVTPSDPDYNYAPYSSEGGSGELALDAEQVWLYEENSMNIVLAAFNELKQLREQRGITDINQRFEMPLMQDGEQIAEGAVIAIKGNPSLGRIGEIGMGVRNPYDPTDTGSPGSPSLDAEFWLNELRLSGFDNEKGWKANAKASFKMADFATVNTNFTRTTTGFGGLDSRLGNRSVADEFGYDLNSTVNLHKLIPDRYGWSFPVNVSTRRNISTPKFLPNQGDTRTQDFINATRNNDELSEAEKETIISERLNDIETVRESFSVNASNISKKNSKSKLAQYTLDNTRLSYVYNQGSLKNPEIQFQDDWNYTSSISYNLSFNNVKLWQPFGFTEDLPFLGVMSKLRLGYMPTSITASANLNRSYNEKRRRPQLDNEGMDQLQPLQQSQTFNHKSSFGLNYNLTPSIPISFRTNTNFDLSGAGREDIPKTGLDIDSTSYQLRPTFETLQGVFFDTLSARRSNYQETYTASWRPKLNQIKALDWLTYSASYSGGYGWTNSPSGSGLGAEVSNTYRLDHTLKLGIGSLLDRISFFEEMKQTDQEETRDRQRNKANNRSQAGEGDEKPTPDLFKDLQYIGRKLVLAVFSMQNIDLSYNQSKTSNQAGYLGNSQIFYAFSDPSSGKYSPPIGYRLGFAEEIPISQLIQESPSSSTINIPKNNTFSDKLAMGTKLNLFSNLSVDLNWSTEWDERVTNNISLTPGGDFGTTLSASGNIGSSVWAFGSGYRSIFERQLQAAFDDLNAEEGIISDMPEAGGNGDGRIVLNRNTLAEDFRYAYIGSGNKAIGKKGYTPIPMPNWRVTWSGVEKIIPFIGNAMSAASLTHAYQGNYRLGWNLNTITGIQDGQGLGAFSVINNKGVYEPASINVEQRFSPLVQLNITWESKLRTQISMDRSRTTSLALSSSTITERTSQGLNATINYTFRNLTIPFFPKIKNNVDLSITGGVADDTEEKFNLGQDIDEVLSTADLIPDVNQYDFNDPFVTGQTRINASLNIGYRFSQTVTSNFEYTFTNVSPKSSAFPPRTNHEIRFNFRIAIQSR